MKFCTCSFLRKALQWGEWVLPQHPALQRNNGWTKCYFLLVVFVCCCSGVWRTILGPALTSCISECWGRRHKALFPSDLRSAWLQHMLLAPREASPWVVRGGPVDAELSACVGLLQPAASQRWCCSVWGCCHHACAFLAATIHGHTV